MQRGTVSKLVNETKCGKIRIQSGEEAHFNKECLWDTPFPKLKEGLEVEFEIQQSYHGLLAFHIRPYLKVR